MSKLPKEREHVPHVLDGEDWVQHLALLRMIQTWRGCVSAVASVVVAWVAYQLSRLDSDRT